MKTLIEATKAFSIAVDKLSFAPPITKVYNPLDYAWAMHEQYLQRFAASPKKIIFLGMNPGPFGMVQTGIPFGEVAAVRDFLKLDATVKIPHPLYAQRPIEGMACTRSEVSGRRLWSFFADRYGSADNFFKHNFVANYCPLAFLEQGRNVTPDKLPSAESAPLYQLCDAYLRDVVKTLEPHMVIGVGKFARKQAEKALKGVYNGAFADILHPSPASPAANRGWAEAVDKQLTGILEL